MPTEAAPTAGESRVGFAGDILWLGITGIVLALITGQADLQPHSRDGCEFGGRGRTLRGAQRQPAAVAWRIADDGRRDWRKVEQHHSDNFDGGADGAWRNQIVASRSQSRSAAGRAPGLQKPYPSPTRTTTKPIRFRVVASPPAWSASAAAESPAAGSGGRAGAGTGPLVADKAASRGGLTSDIAKRQLVAGEGFEPPTLGL